MNNKTYITTTLPYANSTPHIGHAFEFILGDAFARWERSRGRNVFFNIGLDEHGVKIWEAAEKQNVAVQVFVDRLAVKWWQFCTDFNIHYDSFYRTSDAPHKLRVRDVWNRLVKQEDIYKKEYSSWYCKGCESFKKTTELRPFSADGVTDSWECPDHPGTYVDWVSEENYFFRLSKYTQHLKNWFDVRPDERTFLEPKDKYNEFLGLLYDSGDISVSRKRSACPWGVDVPGDEDQVIYVWFDALLNYVFSIGDNLEDWNEFDGRIQLCGPDNLRFQAIIFQGILCALDLGFTDKLLVHGMINDDQGKKMSKTVGNVIDPVDQLNKYGVDAVRYYALGHLNTYQDSSWSEKVLVEQWNAKVCNGLGNLVSRVLHLIDTKLDGEVSDWCEINYFDKATVLYSRGVRAWDTFKPAQALERAADLVDLGNDILQSEQPWKDPDSARVVRVLSTLYSILDYAKVLYAPVFPEKAKEIEAAMESKKKTIIFKRIENATV